MAYAEIGPIINGETTIGMEFQFDYSDNYWFWKIKMDNENGVQVIVEEPNPYHLTSKGKAWITCWDTWVSLCNDESVKERITELFMNFNEKRDLLEITGFKNLRKLVIQDRSSQLIREIMIHGLNNLTEVSIKNCCFNERQKTLNSNFMVFHCPKLRKIKVGKGSLCRLKSCFIHENPSLETIRWGDGSFENCDYFYLKSSLMLSV